MKIQNAPQVAMARPPREHWSTGENQPWVDFQKDQLVSTTDLLKQTNSIPEGGVEACYSFQRDCALMKPATLGEYGLAAAKGAAVGAGVGVAGGVALAVMGEIFTIFTAGFFGQSAGVGLLVPAAIGAAFGAGIGASSLHSEHKDYPHFGESLPGTLRSEYGPDGQKHLQFHPYGELSQKVELEKYASAPTIEGGQSGSNDGQWWQAGYPNVEY